MDNTVFVGVLTIKNLLTIKADIRIFELASGIKVNFSKIFLFSINVGRYFLEFAKGFLQYKVGALRF